MKNIKNMMNREELVEAMVACLAKNLREEWRKTFDLTLKKLHVGGTYLDPLFSVKKVAENKYFVTRLITF